MTEHEIIALIVVNRSLFPLATVLISHRFPNLPAHHLDDGDTDMIVMGV